MWSTIASEGKDALTSFSLVYPVLGSYVGTYYSAKAQKANFKHEAAMADVNAGLATQKAEGAFVQGRTQIFNTMRQYGQQMARQRASMASRGVDMGYGSMAESRATSEFMAQVDYNTMSANALRTAWGFRQEATNYQNQARIARANASAISPSRQAFASLIGSAARSFMMYSAMNGGTPEKSKTPAPIEERKANPLQTASGSGGWQDVKQAMYNEMIKNGGWDNLKQALKIF